MLALPVDCRPRLLSSVLLSAIRCLLCQCLRSAGRLFFSVRRLCLVVYPDRLSGAHRCLDFRDFLTGLYHPTVRHPYRRWPGHPAWVVPQTRPSWYIIHPQISQPSLPCLPAQPCGVYQHRAGCLPALLAPDHDHGQCGVD